MDRVQELFDSITVSTSAYPATLWNVIFAPQKVFANDPDHPSCPTGMTFLLTYGVNYLCFIATNRVIPLSQFLGGWATTETLIMSWFLYFSIIVNIQRAALRVFGFLKCEGSTTLTEVQPLAYAYCIAMLVAGFALSKLPPLPAPFGSEPTLGHSLARSFQPLYLALAFVYGAYVVALYQMCRTGFGLTRRRGILAALVAFMVIVVLTIVCLGVLYFWGVFDG